MKKTALVIGASGDIGLAICRQLASSGYQLILHYHQNKQAIEEFISTCPKQSILQIIQADLSDQADLNRFLDQLMFKVDCIIFSSGKTHFGVFQSASETLMDQMLTLHVKAPWVITKKLLPDMIQRRSGHIILITSIWGTVGASYEVLYSTVKGAQNSFIKALAKEVAPSGVSVNGISPGFIDTKMNRHLDEAEREAVISDIPMQRAGTAEEIAHTVLFLLDEKAKYIQGEIIKVTGGWS